MVEKEEDKKEKVLEMTIEELDSFRSFLQLPQACGYQYRTRANYQDRRRYDEGTELRPQIS